MSSRDRRFSAAVYVPCESGDGRAMRCVADTDAEVVTGIDADVEVALEAKDGAGRADVAVEVDADDDDDPVRMWGWRRGLGVDVEATGDGEPRAFWAGGAPRKLGALWTLLCALWLLFVLWRWLDDELMDEEEPEASARAYGGCGT